MQTYHLFLILIDSNNNTYTMDCPATGDTECTSQADTIGSSRSHRTLHARVPARGSASCNTNRLASSHPTSHRPEMSLLGVTAKGFSSLILTLDTSRIDRVVHDCASCADFMSIRSRYAHDWENDGPGGRGKGESMYKALQSRSSQVISRNHRETCRAKMCHVYNQISMVDSLTVRHRTISRRLGLYSRILRTSSAGSMHNGTGDNGGGSAMTQTRVNSGGEGGDHRLSGIQCSGLYDKPVTTAPIPDRPDRTRGASYLLLRILRQRRSNLWQNTDVRTVRPHDNHPGRPFLSSSSRPFNPFSLLTIDINELMQHHRRTPWRPQLRCHHPRRSSTW